MNRNGKGIKVFFPCHVVWLSITILLLVNSLMLAWSAWLHSPTVLEVSQLPAGLSHLELGKFDLDLVNPPLIRCVAAIPVLAFSPKTDWTLYSTYSRSRAERSVGIKFIDDNRSSSFLLFTVGRWACIPFIFIGGYTCSIWARDLYGNSASIFVVVLWCFSPWILGHGALMTTDAHAAAVGIIAAYFYWRWLKQPDLNWALLAGIAIGYAQLGKHTLIIFYPLGLILWFVYQSSSREILCSKHWLSRLGLLFIIFIVSLFVINVGYAFDGTFKRLGDYQFYSHTLSGDTSYSIPETTEGSNRFAHSLLGKIPIPLPQCYVRGVDIQKSDFERGLRSYMRGEWRSYGWWHFYLYALLIKTPLGTIILFCLAAYLSLFVRGYSAAWQHELFLLLPPVAILGLVSSQTGFSIHSRYLLPALPFFFIWISKTARSFQLHHRNYSIITGIALCCTVLSSLSIFPHSLSYFNELTGGPRHGYKNLVDSNIAWGQDLLFLSHWLEKHPEASPLKLAAFGPVDPRLAGINFSLPPTGPVAKKFWKDTGAEIAGPQPGWFAIDVNHLAGSFAFIPDGQGSRKLLSNEEWNYSYFRYFEPVAFAGYSINIYHITLDEANEVRTELGLPELPPDRIKN